MRNVVGRALTAAFVSATLGACGGVASTIELDPGLKSTLQECGVSLTACEKQCYFNAMQDIELALECWADRCGAREELEMCFE